MATTASPSLLQQLTAYDAASQVITRSWGSYAEQILTYVYDPVGNVVTFQDMSDAGTVYVMDAKDRLTGSASGQEYWYDANDNVLASGDISWGSFTYDLANRISVQTSVGNPNTTFTSDANGNLLGANTNDYPITMTYDYENRLESYVGLDFSSPVTYQYDVDGLKRVENASGAVTQLIWDGSDYLGEAN